MRFEEKPCEGCSCLTSLRQVKSARPDQSLSSQSCRSHYDFFSLPTHEAPQGVCDGPFPFCFEPLYSFETVAIRGVTCTDDGKR